MLPQSRVQRLAKKLCKELKIKLVFSTYKINNMLNNVEYTIPRVLQTHLVYKCTCARCYSCYVGETRWHFTICIRENLKSSHIYKHLTTHAPECKDACTSECRRFQIIDRDTQYVIKIKEAMYIKWSKPVLNK